MEHDVTLPNLLTWGVSYRAAKAVLLTLQYSWSRWEVYEEDVRGRRGAHPGVPRDYENGNVIRGGVEWQATPALALRFGAMHDFSGLQDDHLLADAPRLGHDRRLDRPLAGPSRSRGLALNARSSTATAPEVETRG